MKYIVTLTTAALFSTLGLSAHGQFLINEFEPNQFGPDSAFQQLEIRGTPGASFNGSFLSIDNDTATSVIDRVVSISGILDSNGLLNVSINDLENPSNTLVLIDNSITPIVGTQAIVPTLLPATYDAIGIPDSVGDEAFLIGAALGGTDFVYTGDEPKIIFRDANRPEVIWAVNDPPGSQVFSNDGTAAPINSFFSGDPNLTSFGAINPSNFINITPKINEFEPNQFGPDQSTQQIELIGTPGAAFTGSIISIDTDTDALTIDRVQSVSGTFDELGLLVVETADLENPSFTLALLDDSVTPTQGEPFVLANYVDAALDAIGVPDFPLDVARQVGEELGGIDFLYTGDEPKLIFRDRKNPGVVWAINDPASGVAIDQDGNVVNLTDFEIGNPEALTFGSLNPSLVPEPTSLALLGLGGMMMVRRRRG